MSRRVLEKYPKSMQRAAIDGRECSLGRLTLSIVLDKALTPNNNREICEHNLVSLSLQDANRADLGNPDGATLRRFTIKLPCNRAARNASGALRLLSELFLRMYDEFSQMDVESLREIERSFFESDAITIADSPHPQWLERIKHVLEQRFTEQHKLSEIAAHASVHPVHLAREFRKHYGCSVGEFLRKLRIEYACHQLTASNDPPAKIASAAGFADQSHFSRTFKRLLGTTPGAYRQALKAPLFGRKVNPS